MHLAPWGSQRARTRQQLCTFRRVGILEFWCPAPLACFCVPVLAARPLELGQGWGPGIKNPAPHWTLHPEHLVFAGCFVSWCPFHEGLPQKRDYIQFYDLLQDVGILLSVPALLQVPCSTSAHQCAWILQSALPMQDTLKDTDWIFFLTWQSWHCHFKYKLIMYYTHCRQQVSMLVNHVSTHLNL